MKLDLNFDMCDYSDEKISLMKESRAFSDPNFIAIGNCCYIPEMINDSKNKVSQTNLDTAIIDGRHYFD